MTIESRGFSLDNAFQVTPNSTMFKHSGNEPENNFNELAKSIVDRATVEEAMALLP